MSAGDSTSDGCRECLPICGLLIRKLEIQLHRDGLSPRSPTLVLSMERTVELRAELKSTNRI